MTSETNTIAFRVLLAALGTRQSDVADEMGFTRAVVSTVLNGEVPASADFRDAFLALVEDKLFGLRPEKEMVPTEPLIIHIQKANPDRSPKRWCDLRGIGWKHLQRKDRIPYALADRICGELGIHLSEVY